MHYRSPWSSLIHAAWKPSSVTFHSSLSAMVLQNLCFSDSWTFREFSVKLPVTYSLRHCVYIFIRNKNRSIISWDMSRYVSENSLFRVYRCQWLVTLHPYDNVKGKVEILEENTTWPWHYPLWYTGSRRQHSLLSPLAILKHNILIYSYNGIRTSHS